MLERFHLWPLDFYLNLKKQTITSNNKNTTKNTTHTKLMFQNLNSDRSANTKHTRKASLNL